MEVGTSTQKEDRASSRKAIMLDHDAPVSYQYHFRLTQGTEALNAVR
jgi:hypothetical protein